MRESQSVLKGCSLFAGIEEKELRGLLSCIGAYERVYQKDALIWCEGDKATALGVVLEGSVYVLREDFNGVRSVMGVMERGELFGEAFVCAGVPRIPVTVESRTDTVVLFLPYGRLLGICSNACEHHSRLIQNMLGVLARKNMALSEKLSYLGKGTTREKLLRYLSAQAHRTNAKTFTIPYNRQDLADYLGVERTAMCRELSLLRQQGVIDAQGKRFTLKK